MPFKITKLILFKCDLREHLYAHRFKNNEVSFLNLIEFVVRVDVYSKVKLVRTFTTLINGDKYCTLYQSFTCFNFLIWYSTVQYL